MNINHKTLLKSFFNIIILFIPIVIIYYLINANNPFFTYTLDDPYIHLQLAKNLFSGNYGINTSEFSRPHHR